MPLVIRPAEPADFDATRVLAMDAFANCEIGRFIGELRNSEHLLGEWLAEENGVPIGHIAFTRVWIDAVNGSRIDVAQLAPLAVRPDRQRQGIGTRLTSHVLGELETRGERLFFVLGHPEYYARFGFRMVGIGEIEGPWTGKPSFMVRSRDVLRGRLVLPAVIANAP